MESVPFRGEDPCYVSTDGTLLAVANYTGGTLATYSLRGDGGIAPLDSLLISGTGGPDLSRQDKPHVHCALFSPDGKHLFFSEFSADEIGRLDVVAGGVRGYCRAATLHPDYGPRHLLFDASGQHLYVIGELSGDITVFDYNEGALTEKQVIKADRMDARGAADIHFSPDGKFLYASLRLRGDGIAVFEVGPGGLLSYVGYTATGPHPRNFNITPNGKWVLVACRDNDSVEVYARDRATGMLAPTGRSLAVERPVFVGW
jgi:6-phosphogluconolactonase (cycloisomerase 2 family)